MTHRFIDPISEQPLLSISTGILANEKVTNDMPAAKSMGQAAMKDFTSNRLGKDREKCFYDPIKLMKLGTFATMSKTKECKVNSKVIPLQATKDLFCKDIPHRSDSLNQYEVNISISTWSFALVPC